MKRIEIEREDALDILSCLVDRSVAFHQRRDGSKQAESDPEKTPKVSNTENRQQDRSQLEETENSELKVADEDSPAIDDNNDANSGNEIALSQPEQTADAAPFAKPPLPGVTTAKVVQAIDIFRKMSAEYEELRKLETDESKQSVALDHNERMTILDEFFRSHKYSREMERDALSASTWLRAIGRSSPQALRTSLLSELSGNNSSTDDDPLVYSYSTTDSPDKQSSAMSRLEEASREANTIVIATLKAHLHDAQQKAEESQKCVTQLNAELSTCRAEIGRLRSESRVQVRIYIRLAQINHLLFVKVISTFVFFFL